MLLTKLPLRYCGAVFVSMATLETATYVDDNHAGDNDRGNDDPNPLKGRLGLFVKKE